MNKTIAIELDKKTAEVAANFSRKNREMNFNSEEFFVERIVPTSEHTATVIFKKTSNKKGLAFFYYIPNGASKGWKYFFPTDSHIIGMRAFEFYKLLAEDENYQHNFKPPPHQQSETD